MPRPSRPATYADIEALPENVVGEILGGILHVHPRPALPHALAASVLGGELGPPFQRGRGGPGGWVILYEPELHLIEDVVVPDLAGWRRERAPDLTKAYSTVAPDWVCEVLSDSTKAVDRAKKIPRRRHLPARRHPLRRCEGTHRALRRDRDRARGALDARPSRRALAARRDGLHAARVVVLRAVDQLRHRIALEAG